MKPQTAIVSEKGQVTIPKSLRDVLGITPGTELAFEERDGQLVGKRVLPASPFAALLGQGDKSLGRDSGAVLEELRGPAWTPELDK
jgi:antitoxin PrlF